MFITRLREIQIHLIVTVAVSACASTGEMASPQTEFHGKDQFTIGAAHVCCGANNEWDDKNKKCKNKKVVYNKDSKQHIVKLKKHTIVIPSEFFSNYRDENNDYHDIRENINQFFIGFQEYADNIKKYNKRSKEKKRKKHVLVYMNGGLNKVSSVKRQAFNQIDCMMDVGFYPVFLIWDTGPVTSYFEQSFYVNNGLREDTFRFDLGLINFTADVLQGIARVAKTYNDQIDLFQEAVFPSENSGYRPVYDWTPKYNPNNPVSEDNNIYIRSNTDTPEYTARRIGKSLVYSATVGVRALTTMLWDPLGEAAWENMLRKSRMTVSRPEDYRPSLRPDDNDAENFDKAVRERYLKGSGAFSRFMFELELCSKRKARINDPQDGSPLCADSYDRRTSKFKPADKKTRKGIIRAFRNSSITLIGHSMGAIVINELLLRYPNLNYSDIVFMAAATSLRDVQRTLVPFMRHKMKRKDDVRFYNLMLHPRNDARETIVYGAFPSGSLLESIDMLFEDPPSMLDRTFGKWRNVRHAKDLIDKDVRSRMFFKVFGFEPSSEHDDDPKSCREAGFRPADPRAHGDFNNTCQYFWLPEFWTPTRDFVGPTTPATANRFRPRRPFSRTASKQSPRFRERSASIPIRVPRTLTDFPTRLMRGQIQSEKGAVLVRSDQADVAAMGAHDFLGDGQPQSSAPCRTGEGFEQPGARGFGKTGAGIGDIDSHPAVILMSIDENLSALHGVGRVPTQVEDDAKQLVPVGGDHQVRANSVVPRQLALGGWGQGGAGIGHQGGKRKPAGLDFGFPGSGEIQGLLTQSHGTIDGLHQQGCLLANFGVFTHRQAVGNQNGARQYVSQIMVDLAHGLAERGETRLLPQGPA